ncbi:hypothetical protein PT974_09805 [Cladobotryum mycophilum]|uniref:Bifunctional cytochrome P450/NADPH--P450 reductase n=1 Tax=Cladobotryum mycophilum TaxID=491253 RepID=A0ABR0SIJ5_9HYPO
MSEQIPGPRPLPIIGNILDIDPTDAVASLGKLASKYGPIYKLYLAGNERIFISSRDLLNELSDERRFTKMVSGPLFQLRNACGDSLFTAHSNEANWELSHRILMPAFGPLAIRGMFDQMHDLASQLVVKWARFGSREVINVTSDFTRLTLDTIALCSMGTRFNSFYHEEMHPFIGSMIGVLQESGRRAARPNFANYLIPGSQAQFQEDIETLQKVATEVLDERLANPIDRKDLLNAMIHGKDPKSGEGLTNQSILNNMIVFLIAGHETTSGLISFLFFYLLKYPDVLEKARKEVDQVVGRGPITIEHMSKLPYLEACLRETLRLHPTAPVITIQPRPDLVEDKVTIGGGKYEVSRGQGIACLLIDIQRDPSVFGDDAHEFKAERMLDENFSKLPKNSWKPFGNGVRSCIGRAFAWQESLLVIAMLLQNFDFELTDPDYELKIKQTLTIKPDDLYMHVKLRDHVDAVSLSRVLHGSTSLAGVPVKGTAEPSTSTEQSLKKPITILYGSDSGTCEAMAHSLASVAPSRGYQPTISQMDAAVGKLPTEQPVILISPSYNGQPPNNALQFVSWLENLKGETLKGVKYAVYGCGNRDYVATFHRVPKLLDAELERNGATRIVDTGLGDVITGDIVTDFENWQDEQLWPALGVDEAQDGVGGGFDMKIERNSRSGDLRQDLSEAVVLKNEVLTAAGEPEKRQITVKLPAGLNYRTGDHLAVLPINDWATVRRVFNWAKLPWDTVLTIPRGANTTLPTGRQISARELLSGYVELSQPATRKNIAKIAASASDEAAKKRILALEEDFDNTIRAKRVSVLDILEAFSSISLSFPEFLAMLPPMHPRQYSIATSPLADPSVATLIWSVLDKESSSVAGRRFQGVASNYLASLREGDSIHVATKPALRLFHPPSDVENTTMVMACAGTGFAPFRAFVQERALHVKAGRKLAPAYLFIGCRHPERDALLKEELEQWDKLGCVQVFYAFSQGAEHSQGSTHVQDRIWNERAIIKKAVFEDGANIYVCGSAGVGKSVEDVMKRIYDEAHGASGKEADQWLQGLKLDRFATEIFT